MVHILRFFGNWIADTSELRYTNQHHENILFIEENYEDYIFIDFLDIKYLRLPFPGTVLVLVDQAFKRIGKIILV